MLEAEELERLDSLKARISEFGADETRTPSQINALLVAGLQAQITLMRMSRVFPRRASSRTVDVASALAHRPTAGLARELYHCWKALGLTKTTLKDILTQVVSAIGKQTLTARGGLFVDLQPGVWRGVDPKAGMSLMAEGSGV